MRNNALSLKTFFQPNFLLKNLFSPFSSYESIIGYVTTHTLLKKVLVLGG